MKTHSSPSRHRPRLGWVGVLTWLVGTAQAAPFLYNPEDLLLALRQPGGASDYVVNLGPVTGYTDLPEGTTLVITNLDPAQLASAFPSLNALQWSAAAANRPPGDAQHPLQTIWVTAPRLDPSVPSAAWSRKGSFTQGTAAAQIDAVGVSAAASSSSLPAGPNNTATGVLIPTSSDLALAPILGDAGNYAGTFQGGVENVTGDTFDSSPANVARSDLYELIPGTTSAGTLNTAGRHLGFFEFKPDGSLTFQTGASTPPQPSVAGVSLSGGLATVSFTTVVGARYWLRATSALGTAPPTWIQVSGPVSGTGGLLSLRETNAADQRFYAIEVQP